MTVWRLRVYEKYLDAILDEDKTIEARVPHSDSEVDYDEIEGGDLLMLYTDESDLYTKHPKIAFFETEGNTRYNSAEDMLDEGRLNDIVPEADSISEGEKRCHDVYPECLIDEQGINAIDIGEQLTQYS